MLAVTLTILASIATAHALDALIVWVAYRMWQCHQALKGR